VLEHALREGLQVVFERRYAAPLQVRLDRLVAFGNRVQEVRIRCFPVALLGELVADSQVTAHDQQVKGVELFRAQAGGARLAAFATLAASGGEQHLRVGRLSLRLQASAPAVRKGAGNCDGARACEYACTDAEPNASPNHVLENPLLSAARWPPGRDLIANDNCSQ